MSNEEILERLARLESLVEEQAETIEQQRERISQLEAEEDNSPQVVLDGGDVKVIGEISADDATGVLGKASGSGTTHGVRGEASNGYGLYTPHDANVGGVAEVGGLAGNLTGNATVTTLAGSGLSVENGELTNGVDFATLSVDPLSISNKTDTETFTVDVTVAETAVVTAGGLTVTLEVTDSGDTVVYKETIDATDIRNESTTVTFGVDDGTPELGPFSDGDYTATATCTAINAADATAQDTFTVSAEQAGQTSLVSGSGDTEPADSSIIIFDLENTGSNSVTITDIAVDSTDTSATFVEDEVDFGEFENDADATLYLDARLDIGGATEPLDTNATIGASSTESYNLGQFRDGTGTAGRVSMTTQQATITLTFSDGTTGQYTINT